MPNERDPERGSFPVPCAGSLDDRDTISGVARLLNTTAAHVVRLCINIALPEAVRQVAASEEKVAEVQPMVARLTNRDVVKGRRGRPARAPRP